MAVNSPNARGGEPGASIRIRALITSMKLVGCAFSFYDASVAEKCTHDGLLSGCL
jgi:hypothetical protein